MNAKDWTPEGLREVARNVCNLNATRECHVCGKQIHAGHVCWQCQRAAAEKRVRVKFARKPRVERSVLP